MAQFGIRDADSALSDVAETVEPRNGAASLRNSSVIASSLRNVEPAPQILEQEAQDAGVEQEFNTSTSPPAGFFEMPDTSYENSIQTSPEQEVAMSAKSDDTPTNATGHKFELPAIDLQAESSLSAADPSSPLFIPTYDTPSIPPPRVGPKPAFSAQLNHEPLPTVDGRTSDIYTLPSQRNSSFGALRIQNPEEDEHDWPQEAIMHMNLAGSAHSRTDSRDTNGSRH